MKFFAPALFTAAAVSASAVFNVTDFSAGCIRHSTQCIYAFKVIQPGTMETTPVDCQTLVTSNSNGNLPNVKDAACKDSSRTFSVTRSKEGLQFSVSQPVTPSSNQTGVHFILNAELVTSHDPNAVVQSYKGPSTFDLN